MALQTPWTIQYYARTIQLIYELFLPGHEQVSYHDHVGTRVFHKSLIEF